MDLDIEDYASASLTRLLFGGKIFPFVFSVLKNAHEDLNYIRGNERRGQFSRIRQPSSSASRRLHQTVTKRESRPQEGFCWEVHC